MHVLPTVAYPAILHLDQCTRISSGEGVAIYSGFPSDPALQIQPHLTCSAHLRFSGVSKAFELERLFLGSIITFDLSNTVQFSSVVHSFAHTTFFSVSALLTNSVLLSSPSPTSSHSFEPEHTQQSCTPHSFSCWQLATLPLPGTVSSHTRLAQQPRTTTWQPSQRCQMDICQPASPTTQLTLAQLMDLVRSAISSKI